MILIFCCGVFILMLCSGMMKIRKMGQIPLLGFSSLLKYITDLNWWD
jgi:hypothetical protein